MIDGVLAERRVTHGAFEDDAYIAQTLKRVMREGKRWTEMAVVQRETLDQIATKIGRILSGEPNFPDHWQDIIGYATLVVQRL